MTEILRDKLFLIPKAVIRTTIVILNNIYCIPTYVVWMMILLPVKKCHPNLYYKIEGLLFHWLLSQVSLWAHTAGYDVIELGDDITPCRKRSKRTLVIANHQSTADVPLMMSCFNAKSEILPNIMWIMDRLFKYTNFGIVSLLHLDYFITSGKEKRDASIKQLKKHITSAFIPRRRNWMVLFPEGGFLRKRREISQLYAQKNNLPVLQNVSLPRIGALQAIFEVLPPISNIESITSSSSSTNPSSNLKSQISNNHNNSNNNINNNNTTSLNNNIHLDSNHIHNNNNNNNDICLNNNNGNIINNNNNCYNKNIDNNNCNSYNNNNSINCKKSIINGSVLNTTTTTTNKDNYQKNHSVITKDSNTITSPSSSVENCSNEKIIDNSEQYTKEAATVLDYILDITIAYPNGEPLDLPSIVHGLRHPCQTYFYYRLYHSSEVPKDGIALTNWLFDRWAEKDQILKEYYKTGKFPLKISSQLHNSSNHSNNSSSPSSESLSWHNSTIPPTIVQQDTLRYIIINLFFITSTYVHIQMFYTLLNYCNLYVYSFM